MMLHLCLDIVNCLALLTVPLMLRESPMNLLNSSNIKQPQLKFHSNEGTEGESENQMLLSLINADKIEVVVSTAKNFVKAFALLIAVHYVYNLEYSNDMNCTFLAIQKLILDVADGIKVPCKVLNFICKAKKRI